MTDTLAHAVVEAAKNKELYMLYMEEIWNKGNLALADELFTPTYIARYEFDPNANGSLSALK